MRHFFVTFTTVVFLTLTSSASPAQEPQTPGKEHEEMKAMEGTWDAVMKMGEGDETKGVSNFKMTCGGMWLESDFQCEIGGQKFQGKGLDSYDATKKQYVSIWVDSMNGSPMVLTGTKEGKVTTMTGEGPGPGGAGKFKTITTDESKDKFSFTMFMINDGTETELMTVNYTRRKK